jgi:hypothetical protein
MKHWKPTESETVIPGRKHYRNKNQETRAKKQEARCETREGGCEKGGKLIENIMVNSNSKTRFHSSKFYYNTLTYQTYESRNVYYQ